MKTSEKLRKLAIYFTNEHDYYCKPGAGKESIRQPVEPMAPYPLDMGGWLDHGHFDTVDHEGIPTSSRSGVSGPVYNFTKVCGFALTNFDRYLLTGNPENRERFESTARWLLKSGEASDKQGFVWRYQFAIRDRLPGRISGMAQGQGASVLLRAFFLLGEQMWAQRAVEALKPFELPISKGGVRARFARIDRDWYEETIETPPKHILNGFIFALVGLDEVARHLGIARAQELYDYGIESLTRALPLFDCGFWSYYDYPDVGPYYIASYNYHAMHCALMQCLHRRHPEKGVFLEIGRRWIGYRDSAMQRMRAGLHMLTQKVRRVR